MTLRFDRATSTWELDVGAAAIAPRLHDLARATVGRPVELLPGLNAAGIASQLAIGGNIYSTYAPRQHDDYYLIGQHTSEARGRATAVLLGADPSQWSTPAALTDYTLTAETEGLIMKLARTASTRGIALGGVAQSIIDGQPAGVQAHILPRLAQAANAAPTASAAPAASAAPPLGIAAAIAAALLFLGRR